jgi:hypothetical protein
VKKRSKYENALWSKRKFESRKNSDKNNKKFPEKSEKKKCKSKRKEPGNDERQLSHVTADLKKFIKHEVWKA